MAEIGFPNKQGHFPGAPCPLSWLGAWVIAPITHKLVRDYTHLRQNYCGIIQRCFAAPRGCRESCRLARRSLGGVGRRGLISDVPAVTAMLDRIVQGNPL